MGDQGAFEDQLAYRDCWSQRVKTKLFFQSIPDIVFKWFGHIFKSLECYKVHSAYVCRWLFSF